MKFVIRHELQGRVRIHLYQKEMNLRQADLLHYYICSLPGVTGVKVYERTADAVILFDGRSREILEGLCRFSYENERSGLSPTPFSQCLCGRFIQPSTRSGI